MALPILLTPSRQAPIRRYKPVMIAQEVIGNLTKSFRQMRSPSHSRILNLPLEIVLMIATHLDGCSLLTLTLTCKSFHGLWETRNLPLRLTEKEQFLDLLEKDNPFLYCCHCCMKLHRWHGRWKKVCC